MNLSTPTWIATVMAGEACASSWLAIRAGRFTSTATTSCSFRERFDTTEVGIASGGDSDLFGERHAQVDPDREDPVVVDVIRHGAEGGLDPPVRR